MRKSLLLSGLILAFAMWVQAQPYPQASATQPGADSGSSTTVQGCLSGSAGSYVLTASNGNTYMLTGETSGLKDHVGHEVSITGKVSGSSAPSASSTPGASSANTGAQSLEVQSMKHISASCTSTRK